MRGIIPKILYISISGIVRSCRICLFRVGRRGRLRRRSRILMHRSGDPAVNGGWIKGAVREVRRIVSYRSECDRKRR